MTAYYNEIDPYAAAWLRNLITAGHIAPGDVDERSIIDVQPDDLKPYTQCHFFAGIGVWSYALRRAGWPDDRPVWTGSCPCQPFSAAGKQEGTTDARHLWPEWFRLIREHRPVAIFGEQVSAAIRHGWLDLVSSDLEGLDYAIGSAVVGAHSVGAPHIRQRLFFVADSAGERRVGERLLLRAEERGRLAGDVLEAAGSREAGELADSDGRNSGAEGLQRSRQHGQQPQDGGADCALGDTDDAGSQGHGRHVEQHGSQGRQGTKRHDSSTGFWSNADWLPCIDGKARPVEPGTFPLAHGAPVRVGRLRAYGNAINAESAKAFIEAYLG